MDAEDDAHKPSEIITSVKQINGVKNVKVTVLLIYYYKEDVCLPCVCHMLQA
jgi:hypothetical protein